MLHSDATSSRRSPVVRLRGPARQTDVSRLQRFSAFAKKIGQLDPVHHG